MFKNVINIPRAVSVALLGLLIFGLLSLASPPASPPLHITAADLMTHDILTRSTPPRQVDPRQFSGTWRHQTLPYAPPVSGAVSHLLGQRPSGTLEESWFRFNAPAPRYLHAPLYLYMSRRNASGQIALYADGNLIYQSHGNDIWNGGNQPLWIPLDETAGNVPPHEFLIRLQHEKEQIGLSSVWVGNYNDLNGHYMLRYFFVVILPAASSAGMLVTGLFALVVWLRRRAQWIYLFFFLLSVAAFAESLHVPLGAGRLPISDAWFSWLTANSILWVIGMLHLILVEIHRRRQPWLSFAVWASILFWTVVSLPSFHGNNALTHDGTFNSDGPIELSALVMGLLVFQAGCRASWRNRILDGLMLSGCVLLFIIFGLHDWLLENNWINAEGLAIGLYLNFVITLVFRRIMLDQFLSALATAERAADNLAEQLHMRERELAESYERLRLTERRQVLADERQRVMQDMHDGMGSSLVSAVHAIERGKLDPSEIARILRSCIDDLKLTVDAMEPAEADLLLLLATLRFRLQPRFDSIGLKLFWQVRDVPPIDWLDHRASLHILRILQETFTNIIKHAHASEVIVATDIAADVVSVMITDNGRGFDVNDVMSHGKGLGNQIRRAKSIGCEVHWDMGAPGTRFCLKLPINVMTSATERTIDLKTSANTLAV